MRGLIWCLLVAVPLAGCGTIPYKTAANEPLCPAKESCASPDPTRAKISVDGLPRDTFVGVAISGGGMRAANFSLEVLFELDDLLGLRDHISAVSSVSGGSLTAAYLGLAGNGKVAWDRDAAERLFVENLQAYWFVWWFNPYFIWQYWLTHFDRSDIMEKIFDAFIFENLVRPFTFADMGTTGPRILLNATSLPNLQGFVFTEEAFKKLGSRIDKYPLSHAVMASGAFPGIFHNVTLRDFTGKNPSDGPPLNDGVPHRYEHLFDGGAADNLGVGTLATILDQLKPKACLLFVVDAYAEVLNRGRHEGDTRRWSDFVLDRNALDAVGVLLTLQRRNTLRALDYPDGKPPGVQATWVWTSSRGYQCTVWHLTFDHVAELRLRAARSGKRIEESGTPAAQLRTKKLLEDVNQIPTAYNLSGPEDMSAQAVQDDLRLIARELVWGDEEARRTACQWFWNAFGVTCRLKPLR